MRDINFVIKTVAKEKNLDEKIVEIVTMEYWKRIIKLLDSYKYPNIYITKIGSLGVPYTVLRKHILNNISYIKQNKDLKPIKESRMKVLKNLLKLRPVVSKYYFQKLNRWKNESNKKSMGE